MMITETDKANENRTEPKVSIVIASYNTPEEYLKNCLESIYKQSYTNIETVIVDDGSEPAASKRIDKLSRQDGRIIVVHQENKGVSAARNKGTELCSGDYVVYLDADDSLTPWFLEQAVSAAGQEDADAVFGLICRDMHEYPSESRISPVRILSREDGWLKKNLLIQGYKKGTVRFACGCWARLIRTDIAKMTPFPEGVAIGEDLLWNLDLMETARRKCVTDGVWYNYLIHPGSVTDRYDPEVERRLKPFYDRFASYREYTGDRYYRARVFGDLVKFVFGSYYGHPSNPDSFFTRWRGFSQACKRLPWCESCRLKVFQQDSVAKGLRVFLYKIGLLFPVESVIKSHRRARPNKTGKEEKTLIQSVTEDGKEYTGEGNT